MSENRNSQESKSCMEREDWLVFLTGGLISSGAIGWLVYKDFKAQSLDYKAIMTIAASFAGGMGIYFTSSALIQMLGKPDEKWMNSVTSKKEAPEFTDTEKASLCEKLVDVMTELEEKFEASKAKECKSSNKRTLMDKTQEWTEVSRKNEDMIKRLNDANQKGPRTDKKMSPDKLKENIFNEGIGNRIAKFREKIFSSICELKGYVQGTIDPLPSARNLHFISTEMSDEMRQQVVMIVKEYANSMLPKLEQVIDEFVDSVCKAVEVPDYDKEHKVKKAFETLGVSEKDWSLEHLKNEINQYYKALENATKNKPLAKSSKNDQRCDNTFGVNLQPLESSSIPSLHDKDQVAWPKNLKRSHPKLPKLQIPTSDIPLMSKEAYKPGNSTDEKTKNTEPDPPAKLILTEEQMEFLNVLKSEV